jgi:heterodisulfide reductase subunit C2
MHEPVENVVNELAHTRVEDCYQCGKCTAGCPMADVMDLMPNQIIRLAQMGEISRATTCSAIWLCVACQTCSERCPKDVDIAGVMDAMRQLSLERGEANEAVQRTVVFQRAFLDNIKRNGRLNELELIGQYKTVGFFGDKSVPLLLKDAMLAPKMLQRHKLHFRGERVQDRGIVKRIFERCMGRERE